MKMLSYSVVCVTLFLKVVTVRAQCERPSVGENRVLTPESYKTTYPDGSTAKFKCSIGYKPVHFRHSKVIKCTGGQWTELQLKCTKKSCGALPDIMNGRYDFSEGIEFGATAVAECNEGYQLVGQSNKHRYCQDSGWSGRDPVCQVVQCQEPPGIENGQLEEEPYDSYEYGQAVTYVCNRGFILVGSATISCSNNGEFQDPPKCLREGCDKPTIPNAVRIDGRMPPYKSRSTLRYECDMGYRMNGSDYIICDVNKWVPSPPQCIEIRCPKPDLENGQHVEPSQETYKNGQVLTYSCMQGFKLEGPSKIKCSDDETFQPSPPQCLEITCGTPDVPNGTITDEKALSYRNNSRVQYSCNTGYRSVGDSHLVCKENGWNPPPPQCKAIQCPEPHCVENGQHDQPSQETYRHGQVLTYSCMQGFKLKGTPKITCSDDGTFHPSPPQCLAIQCPEPHRVENGQHDQPSQETYRHGQVLTYSCMQGFKLEGPSKITCSDDETFQPSPPQCLEITCGTPDVLNGTITGEKALSYRYNSSVQYSCNTGYRSVGDSHLVCKENGWNPSPPQCKAIQCPEPHRVENGQHEPSQETYRHGQVLTYSCMQGFKLEGPSKITCSDDETFQPSPPQCVEITCGTPDVPNGTITDEKALSYRYNSSVQYSCNTGYRSVGDSHLVCKENGWNPPPPQCKEIQCPKPHRVENGQHDQPSQETYIYGQVLTYSCLQGFKLEGTSKITCSDNETFHPSPPQCLAIRCPEPHRVENGQHDQPSQETYRHGQVLTYSCLQGFKLEGTSKITCSDDETFHPSPPQCLEITCGTPDVLNGTITGEKALSYRYNSRVQYSCNTGYRSVGDSHLVCKENGWNPPPPQCKEIRCPKPHRVENGQHEPSQETYIYGQVLTYSCMQGFKLKGTPKITCSDDGTLHPSPPQCVAIQCPEPHRVENGKHDQPSQETYRHGKVLTYSCMQGFKLEGTSKITCSDDETFHPSPPQCVEITCGTPDVLNGTITGEKALSYRYNSRVQYSCNTGYRSVGDSHLVCKENGWNPPPPQCKEIRCPEPHRVENGHHDEPSQETYIYGQVLTYSCLQGFKLKGTSKITCSDNKTFHSSPPQCLAIRCPEPHPVENGQHDQPSQETYRHGQVLTYSCLQGFKLEGPSKITCSDDETFHPSPPQCLEVICGTPNVSNGQITNEKALPYRNNSRVHYSCNTGYRSDGDSHLVCTENGWNQPSPQCIMIKCQRPDLNIGTLEPIQESYDYAQEVTYHCAVLFYSRVSNMLCSADGTFKPLPRCVGQYGILVSVLLLLLVILIVAVGVLLKMKKLSHSYSPAVQYYKEDPSLK